MLNAAFQALLCLDFIFAVGDFLRLVKVLDGACQF